MTSIAFGDSSSRRLARAAADSSLSRVSVGGRMKEGRPSRPRLSRIEGSVLMTATLQRLWGD
jgi:hypothetical protein